MPSDVVSLAVILILTIWWLLSVLNQVSAISSMLARGDLFGLLPKWTFFAPNPGVHDYHIVRRTYVVSDDTSDTKGEGGRSLMWEGVSCSTGAVEIPFLWNPDRRLRKTLSDIANGLLMALRVVADKRDLIQFTPGYFLLTHLAQRGVAEGTLIQWAIVRSFGFEGQRDLGVVFVSFVHRVSRTSTDA